MANYYNDKNTPTPILKKEFPDHNGITLGTSQTPHYDEFGDIPNTYYYPNTYPHHQTRMLKNDFNDFVYRHIDSKEEGRENQIEDGYRGDDKNEAFDKAIEQLNEDLFGVNSPINIIPKKSDDIGDTLKWVMMRLSSLYRQYPSTRRQRIVRDIGEAAMRKAYRMETIRTILGEKIDLTKLENPAMKMLERLICQISNVKDIDDVQDKTLIQSLGKILEYRQFFAVLSGNEKVEDGQNDDDELLVF